MYLLLFLGVVVAFLYYKITRIYNFWKRKNVIYIKPWPIVGNFGPNVLAQKSFAHIIEDLYDRHPNERYVGVYQLLTPLLMIRDPELLKQIMVKDFDHFSDHRTIFPEDVDPLWGKNLFQMSTERWKDMRPILSPVFTSSKMKTMFASMSECAEQFINYFLNQNSDLLNLEMRDTTTRFATDVIAKVAYGITCDSLIDRKNEFYLRSLDISKFGGFGGLKFFAFSLSPTLTRFLKITIFNDKIRTFFRRIVAENVTMRRRNNITRPDLIHLLMEAQSGRLKYEEGSKLPETGFATVQESSIGKRVNNQKFQISDEDIVAQALVFFFGGSDTIPFLLCFLTYELCVNYEIQKRLQQEVDETLKNCGGKITYEMLLGMKYLDMVVTETLRKWPPPIIDRKCVKPYIIKAEKPGEEPLKIDVGTLCMIPVYGLHHDPKYYRDPAKFDPERFSEKNRDKVLPFTYMPFGFGPRNCIASRFALLEAKVLIFHILTRFEIVPVEKTPIPFVLSKTNIMMSSPTGFWMGLKKRVSKL